MYPDDNPDARRATSPSGRPPSAAPPGRPRNQGPGGDAARPGPRPGGPGQWSGADRRPTGDTTGGQRFSAPFPQRPSGPPQVLSGPAANSNAAYSLQSHESEYRRDDHADDHVRTSTAGHDLHDSPRYDDPLHDDPGAGDVTASPRNNTNIVAVVALVLSFLGLTSLFGVVCGHVARRQIRTTKEQGDSLAIAALWIGYVYIGAAALCLVVYFWIRTQGA